MTIHEAQEPLAMGCAITRATWGRSDWTLKLMMTDNGPAAQASCMEMTITTEDLNAVDWIIVAN